MAIELDYKAAIHDAFEVVKANLVPSLVLGVICAIPPLTFAAPLCVVNYLIAARKARSEGRTIELADLFDMEHAADKWLGTFVAGFAYSLFVLPGVLILFTPCILADRPGIPFVRALKGAFAFGKANLVPSLMFSLVCLVLLVVAQVACFLPVFFAIPTVLVATLVVYEQHRPSIEAAAAASGVQLA